MADKPKDDVNVRRLLRQVHQALDKNAPSATTSRARAKAIAEILEGKPRPKKRDVAPTARPGSASAGASNKPSKPSATPARSAAAPAKRPGRLPFMAPRRAAPKGGK